MDKGDENLVMIKMGIKGPVKEAYAEPDDECVVCGRLIGGQERDRRTWNGWAMCFPCWDDLDLEPAWKFDGHE
jgi:hypothetical protein